MLWGSGTVGKEDDLATAPASPVPHGERQWDADGGGDVPSRGSVRVLPKLRPRWGKCPTPLVSVVLTLPLCRPYTLPSLTLPTCPAVPTLSPCHQHAQEEAHNTCGEHAAYTGPGSPPLPPLPLLCIPGEEVHNTYGEHGNAELLAKYGFALCDNPFTSGEHAYLWWGSLYCLFCLC